jgi:DNA replication protein DnaC
MMKEYTCPVHGTFIDEEITFSSKNGQSYTIIPLCPQCAAAKCAEHEAEEREREKTYKESISRLTEMNIAEDFWYESFDTFRADTSELAHHLAVCRAFAAHPHGKLVMLGNNGTGKTHLAAAILREKYGKIYTAMEISLRLKATFHEEISQMDILNKLCALPILVIDEIGRTAVTDFELNWISHVINKRHEHHKPLILISNRHMRADCEQVDERGERGCPKCLENYFDNDVISRIIGDGAILKFTGADYRYKKRMEKR